MFVFASDAFVYSENLDPRVGRHAATSRVRCKYLVIIFSILFFVHLIFACSPSIGISVANPS